MTEELPEEARRQLAAIVRYRQELGKVARPAPDPDAVRRMAESADAIPELKAVAAAVRAGRTTWAQAVAGEADHLPEVQEYYAAAGRRIRTLVHDRLTEPTDDLDDARPLLRDAW